MCGIIGVVRRPVTDGVLDSNEVLGRLTAASVSLGAVDPHDDLAAKTLHHIADELHDVDRQLRWFPGLRTLVTDAVLTEAIVVTTTAMTRLVSDLEATLDSDGDRYDELELVNAALVRVRDGLWIVERDRVRTAVAVRALAGPNAPPSAVAALWSVQVALSAIDRLEVRGRDSAGLQVTVTGHGLDLATEPHASQFRDRSNDLAFRSGSVRWCDGALVFVYKAAAEIGELGDNTAALRAELAADPLLRAAISAPGAHVSVLGHTRWASVGIISEANAHPMEQTELGRPAGPYVAAVLNGDVDNFADLKAANALRIAPEITSDAKVIPTLVSRHLDAGVPVAESFRSTVAGFHGSVAIAASTTRRPHDLFLAQRGSGQALYIGLAEDAFVVASEPYGLVEVADAYVRLDGETPSDPRNPMASRGQIAVLDGAAAGSLAGIERSSYDGTALPIGDLDVVRPEITTRDIDRGDSPHFFLKEIGQAPRSVRTTMRGRVVTTPGGDLAVRLGDDTLPADLRRRLADGEIRRVVAIGQGTAAVAARSFAHHADALLGPGGVVVESTLATDFSGFGLAGDMSDTLVVAVSQSGTTTDTNRTVDLARARGAAVVSIVNRRQSDLTDKSDGVLYTSDGRDVEMSVASTKAFYAQIVAGILLAHALADLLAPAHVDPPRRAALLRALRQLPEAMERVIAQREHVGGVARRHATAHRYWSVVGNGPNRVAASEIRIKLSELCYKAIAEDGTEDKKHIDLSSEPLILVCAAGLYGSNADDVAKEVGIFAAHKATPVVIATEGEARFEAAADLLGVPAVHPDLDFVLSVVMGHLFGYEAALAIDAMARPLREARAAIETAAAGGSLRPDDLPGLQRALTRASLRYSEDLRAGRYDGCSTPSQASRLGTLFRFATGMSPLDAYEAEMGKAGRPGVVMEDLARALSDSIDELTRPVDAIKHQAKTVTVGISRSDETLLQAPLVRAVVDAGAPRERLSYNTLQLLAALDPSVEQVLGHTRYRVDGDIDLGATAQVVDRGGIAIDIPSRTESDPRLRGTKHRAAAEQLVTVSRGRRDGRTTVIVPETKDGQTTGITLLHCRFARRLPPIVAATVLDGYRGRLQAIEDAVTEVLPTFRHDLLGELPMVDLLTLPVYVLAEYWTQP